MIDINKTYKTKSGKRVFGLKIVMQNSCGRDVTFPVKGTIILSEKPRRTSYAIWTLEGRADVLKETGRDLVEA